MIYSSLVGVNALSTFLRKYDVARCKINQVYSKLKNDLTRRELIKMTQEWGVIAVPKVIGPSPRYKAH